MTMHSGVVVYSLELDVLPASVGSSPIMIDGSFIVQYYVPKSVKNTDEYVENTFTSLVNKYFFKLICYFTVIL